MYFLTGLLQLSSTAQARGRQAEGTGMAISSLRLVNSKASVSVWKRENVRVCTSVSGDEERQAGGTAWKCQIPPPSCSGHLSTMRPFPIPANRSQSTPTKRGTDLRALGQRHSNMMLESQYPSFSSRENGSQALDTDDDDDDGDVSQPNPPTT